MRRTGKPGIPQYIEVGRKNKDQSSWITTEGNGGCVPVDDVGDSTKVTVSPTTTTRIQIPNLLLPLKQTDKGIPKVFMVEFYM